MFGSEREVWFVGIGLLIGIERSARCGRRMTLAWDRVAVARTKRMARMLDGCMVSV